MAATGDGVRRSGCCIDRRLDLPSHRRHDSAAAWRRVGVGGAARAVRPSDIETACRRTAMFGRRKSNEGFEWHKYVRTTIKLKREQRRQRVVDARRAAVQQAGEAGVALAAGSRAAGAAAAGRRSRGAGRRRTAGAGAVEHRGDGVRDRLAQSCQPCRRWSGTSWRSCCSLSSPRLRVPTSAAPSRSPAPSRWPGSWPLQRHRDRPGGDLRAGARRRPARSRPAAAVEPDRHPPAAAARARHLAGRWASSSSGLRW